MAENINSMNFCDAYHVDENKNLPNSEKCSKELLVTNEFKVNSTSQSVKIKDVLPQNSSDSVINNNCLGDGLSSESSVGEIKVNCQTDVELPEIDENPNLLFNISDKQSILQNSSDKPGDLLDISLNQSLDGFGLNLNEVNNENVKDEVFHDAVQFFKDPSSFTFLENMGGPSVANDFTRSSICKNFDPLHAKFSSRDSNKINSLQCINEASIEPESFCDESLPVSASGPLTFSDELPPKCVLEPLPFHDELEPKFVPQTLDGVLISFNSPLTCKVSDVQQNHNITIELPQACPENDSNPNCKVEELEVPELLANDELNSQCEVAERSEDKVIQTAEENNSCLTANEAEIPRENTADVIQHNGDRHGRSLSANESKIIAEISCENTADNIQCNEVEHTISISRESVGNTLMSFDSPLKCKSLPKENAGVQKMYTEEDLQQALKIQELQSQEILLKKQQEMELEIANIKQKMDDRVLKGDKVCRTFHCIIEELSAVILDYSNKQKDSLKYIETLEQENSSLKGDVKTLTEDLQSVENTFSDFHKRYEQCKAMLKVYKDNEEGFKLLNEKIQNELKEQKDMYALLQLRTQEITERANLEVANEKKSSIAQLTVLKAQLQKAELKISSLESDNKQLRIETSKLSGIIDDLMARVSGT